MYYYLPFWFIKMIDDFFELLSAYSFIANRILRLIIIPWLWYVDEYKVIAILILVWILGVQLGYKVIIAPLAILFEKAYDKFYYEEKKSSLLQICILITCVHFLMLLTRSFLSPIVMKYGYDKFFVNDEFSLTSSVIPIFLATIVAAVSPWFVFFYESTYPFTTSSFFIKSRIKEYSLTLLFFSHLVIS